MQRVRQSMLVFPQRGGARRGAGRRPKGKHAGVSHSKRAAFAARHPLHVTLRVVSGLRSLRTPRAHNELRRALVLGASRLGMRLVQYTIQTNHIHLICEAQGNESLSRGIKGLSVRIAKALNRIWSRAGSIFADRFHSRALKTPREVRNALNYVLHNAAHHGIHFAGPDPCSSGAWFDGWEQLRNDKAASASPLPAARTWLLTVGWRRHGLIELRAR